jgi:PPM family protein phosphatase
LNKQESTSPATSERSIPLTFAKALVAHPDHYAQNEDFAITDALTGLAVLCDGVGSVMGAAQASRAAARAVKRHWRQMLAEPALSTLEPIDAPKLAALAYQLVMEANQAVIALDARLLRNIEEADRPRHLAQTTIVLTLLYPQANGYLLACAHVGDSRIYLLRQNATLQRLTIDDGYFLYLMQRNEIDEQDAARIDQASSADQLTETEREHFGKRNGITQALGDRTVEIHVGQTEISPGDRMLLCSDGIHDNLTDEEIEKLLRQGARTTVARALVQEAQIRSREDAEVQIRAKKDDMSAVVITCQQPI